jgi:hypothetical protein
MAESRYSEGDSGPLTTAAEAGSLSEHKKNGEAALVRHHEGPKRLGDLAERLWVLRLDCRRCGHFCFVKPRTLYGRWGPSHPWRWLRFRCRECRSADVPVRAGRPIDLQQAPMPLWRREDLLEIIVEAVDTYCRYIGGDMVSISRERAEGIAEMVLRRLMAAGVQISAPEPENPPPRAS